MDDSGFGRRPVLSERAAPQYCPYCGDEDLRPSEGSHRQWSCRSCRRVFEVTFIGLLAFGDTASSPAPGQRND